MRRKLALILLIVFVMLSCCAVLVACGEDATNSGGDGNDSGNNGNGGGGSNPPVEKTTEEKYDEFLNKLDTQTSGTIDFELEIVGYETGIGEIIIDEQYFSFQTETQHDTQKYSTQSYIKRDGNYIFYLQNPTYDSDLFTEYQQNHITNYTMSSWIEYMVQMYLEMPTYIDVFKLVANEAEFGEEQATFDFIFTVSNREIPVTDGVVKFNENGSVNIQCKFVIVSQEYRLDFTVSDVGSTEMKMSDNVKQVFDSITEKEYFFADLSYDLRKASGKVTVDYIGMDNESSGTTVSLFNSGEMYVVNTFNVAYTEAVIKRNDSYIYVKRTTGKKGNYQYSTDFSYDKNISYALDTVWEQTHYISLFSEYFEYNQSTGKYEATKEALENSENQFSYYQSFTIQKTADGYVIEAWYKEAVNDAKGITITISELGVAQKYEVPQDIIAECDKFLAGN